MNIAIIGAGAMGCLFAARLQGQGTALTLIDIDPATLDTLDRQGIVVQRSHGQLSSQHPVTALRADQARGHFDLIVLFTKAFHTASALASVGHLLGDDTYVLTLQNGLGHVDTITACVASARVIVGVTDIPADLIGIGQVHTPGAGSIRLWSHDGQQRPMLDRLSRLFNEAGLPCTADPQVQVAIWHKAAFNAALNALCTLLREPVGRIGHGDHGRWLVAAVVDESAAVAIALGVAFNRETVLAMVEKVYDQQAEHKPSMLQDRLAGRRSEIDNINGAIVRAAHRQGIATPVVESLYRLVCMGEPE
jgi:2-dehydropantoate 2-reductase